MYRYFYLFLLAVVFMAAGCRRSVEREQIFDYGWQFSADGGREWRSICLPHDWSIEGSFSPENMMGGAGGYLPDGKGVYRKTFSLGREYEGKNLSLYFEGVYMNAAVKVNGREAGTHGYGYTSFAVDITDMVRTPGENIVEVTVDNSAQQNCRWYSGSGIFRHVRLIAAGNVRLKHWGSFIFTPQVSAEKAVAVIKTTVQNDTDSDVSVVVRAEVEGGKLSAERPVMLNARSEKEVEMEIVINSPRLWDVAAAGDGGAELYDAEISVLREGEGEVLDAVTETFGVRSVEYSAAGGFRLNGRNMKIFGGCVHHDNGILGAAAFDRAEERKVEMLKAAGYNAVRTSHNPVSEAFLDACDRLGMMVVDEAFDGWYAEKTAHDYHELIDDNWREDLSSMIMRDRNHPSVIAWSIGNEIIERDTPEAVETARRFVALCHELDPTRPVTQALACWNGNWKGQDALAAEHDIVGYNYLLDWAPDDHKRVPDRIVWQTESFPRDVYKNYRLVSENPYIIGDFVWTAIDYLGESGIGRWYYDGETPGEHYQNDQYPWHGAYCGDIDLTGWRKPVSYYRQMVFAPETACDIYMAVKEPDGYYGKIRETAWSVWPTWTSWNWPGWENRPVEVEVYSKYPEVRLYLNGVRVEGGVRNNEFLTTFSVPYSKGTLRAVGVVEGSETGEAVLSTAGEPHSLRLTPDRDVLSADGQDLSFITVEVVDSEGCLCPDAGISFTCSVDNYPASGDAAVIAAGNANLKDCDPYHDLSHSTWKGRALIVVRAPQKSGRAELKVQSSLPESACSIRFE